MTVLDVAAKHGWPVVTDPHLPIDPAAARLLPSDSVGVAVATAANVLEVVCDHIPSAAQIGAFERLTGHLVSVSVASPAVLEVLRERAHEHGEVRGVGALLSEVPESVTRLTLQVGRPPLAHTETGVEPVSGWSAASKDDVLAWHEFLLGDTGVRQGLVRWEGSHWRVRSVNEPGGTPTLVLRRTVGHTVGLEQLGLPADTADVASLLEGLVVVASPTGQGRSSTLRAMLERITTLRPCALTHVVEVDETPLASRKAWVNTRVLGRETSSVAAAARDAVSDATDVLAVDVVSLSADDVEALLETAGSGVLVLVTVTAAGLTSALSRLSTTVNADRVAAVNTRLGEVFAAGVAQLLLPDASEARVPVTELWWATPAIGIVLRSGELHRLTSAALSSRGRHPNTSLTESLKALVDAGRITELVASRYGHVRTRAAVVADDVPDAWLVEASTSTQKPGSRAVTDRRRPRGRKAARKREASKLLNEKLDL